jgi:hypothetical protein
LKRKKPPKDPRSPSGGAILRAALPLKCGPALDRMFNADGQRWPVTPDLLNLLYPNLVPTLPQRSKALIFMYFIDCLRLFANSFGSHVACLFFEHMRNGCAFCSQLRPPPSIACA